MKQRLADKVFNEVYSYGGFPMRLGDIITHLDEVAKSLDKNNWFAIREAGLQGLMFHHNYKPLTNVEPISMAEFRQIIKEVR